MNVEQFRDFCLSLQGVSEAMPFDKFAKGKLAILVFYVSGHMFCYFNIDDFTSVTIKGTPERMNALKEHYAAVGEPFNGNKKYWMSVKVNADVDDDLLRQLVEESYRLVRDKYK